MADPDGISPSGVSIGTRGGRGQRWEAMTSDSREGGDVVMATIAIPRLGMWLGLMVALRGLWSFHEEAERGCQRQDGVRRLKELHPRTEAELATEASRHRRT